MSQRGKLVMVLVVVVTVIAVCLLVESTHPGLLHEIGEGFKEGYLDWFYPLR